LPTDKPPVKITVNNDIVLVSAFSHKSFLFRYYIYYYLHYLIDLKTLSLINQVSSTTTKQNPSGNIENDFLQNSGNFCFGNNGYSQFIIEGNKRYINYNKNNNDSLYAYFKQYNTYLRAKGNIIEKLELGTNQNLGSITLPYELIKVISNKIDMYGLIYQKGDEIILEIFNYETSTKIRTLSLSPKVFQTIDLVGDYLINPIIGSTNAYCKKVL